VTKDLSEDAVRELARKVTVHLWNEWKLYKHGWDEEPTAEAGVVGLLFVALKGVLPAVRPAGVPPDYVPCQMDCGRWAWTPEGRTPTCWTCHFKKFPEARKMFKKEAKDHPDWTPPAVSAARPTKPRGCTCAGNTVALDCPIHGER